MKNDLISIKAKLKEASQEHVLMFWDELNESEQIALKNQIENINFNEIQNLYENSKKDEQFDKEAISPLNYFCSDEMSESEKDNYIHIGESIIRNSEVAVVSMAGGQRY